MKLQTLYRPVGVRELKLIHESGMKTFYGERYRAGKNVEKLVKEG